MNFQLQKSNFINVRSIILNIALVVLAVLGLTANSYAQTGGPSNCPGHSHSDAAGAGGIGSTVSCPNHTHSIDANNISNLADAINDVIANTTPPAGDPGDPVVPDATEDDAPDPPQPPAIDATTGLPDTGGVDPISLPDIPQAGGQCAQDLDDDQNAADIASATLGFGAFIADGVGLAAEAIAEAIPLIGSALSIPGIVAQGVSLGLNVGAAIADTVSLANGITAQGLPECSTNFQGDIVIRPEERSQADADAVRPGTGTGNQGAGNLLVTEGEITAALGDVNAGDDVTAVNDVTAGDTVTVEGGAIVIGVEDDASGAAIGIAIGGGAISGVGTGTDATNTDASGVALGTGASTTGADATAIGDGATAETEGSTAVGAGAEANGEGSFAGGNSDANGQGAVSIGDQNIATGAGAVAIGDPNIATGTGAVAVGADNMAIGDGAVAVGNSNNALGLGAVAVG